MRATFVGWVPEPTEWTDYPLVPIVDLLGFYCLHKGASVAHRVVVSVLVAGVPVPDPVAIVCPMFYVLRLWVADFC